MKSNIAETNAPAIAAPSPEAKAAPPNRANSIISVARSAAGLLVAVALVWIAFSFLTDGVFVSDRNVTNLMRQTAITAMVALGMLVVVAQGNRSVRGFIHEPLRDRCRPA